MFSLTNRIYSGIIINEKDCEERKMKRSLLSQILKTANMESIAKTHIMIKIAKLSKSFMIIMALGPKRTT